MSELSAAEKRVFGEHATKDAAGNIIEKAIGFVTKEIDNLVHLTQDEFNTLLGKANAWDNHMAANVEPAPVAPPAEPAAALPAQG